MSNVSNTGGNNRPQWAATVVAVIALLAGLFGTFRAYRAQQQANSIAQENIVVQKQLQEQSQASQARAQAQSVAITTFPPEVIVGQGAQGIVVDNGSRVTITSVEVVFTNGSTGIISAVSPIPWLTACETVELQFTSSYSPPAGFDAWLYFSDANGNIWLTDLLGHLYKVKEEPNGTNVSSELTHVPGTMAQGTCG